MTCSSWIDSVVTFLVGFYTTIHDETNGSESQTTHFATWYSSLATLIMMGTSVGFLAATPMMDVEWNEINSTAYLWTWTIWIVLFGVMSTLDWTSFGTFFEILHPVTETMLTFACFDQFFIGVIVCTVWFASELILLYRTASRTQYAVALIVGSFSHYANLTALIVFAVRNYKSAPILWMLPAAMVAHFAYDSAYVVLANCTSFCLVINWAKQVGLPFFNCAAIIIANVFIWNYSTL